jgi:hypothetical protein
MKPQLVYGAMILIAGVALLIFGMNASHSMADQMSNSVYGRFTQGTTWYILGGLAAGLLGLYLLLTNLLSKNA